MKKTWLILILTLLLIGCATACGEETKAPENETTDTTDTTVTVTEPETKPEVILDGSEGLLYTSHKNGTCSVSGIGTCTDRHLVIPTVSPDGERVTAIAEGAFMGNTDILTLTIPEGIVDVEDQAFAGCTRLMSVRLPKSIEYIGDSSFKDSVKIVEVIAPEVLGIQPADDKNGFVAYYAKSVHHESESKLVEENGYYFFDADGRHYLMDYAGEEDELALPAYEGTDEYFIYLRAFYGREELTAVTLPDGLDGIGGEAFFGCTGLTEITIPASVENYSIDFKDYASRQFGGCTSLVSVTFAEGTEMIPGYLFGESASLKNVTIPEGATLLCGGAFKDCTALETVYLPASLTDICEKAFAGCTSLKEIRLPDGLEAVANNLFEGCTGLTSIKIPDSVTAIWGSAFSKCESLESVVLPEGLTEIDGHAFEGCAKLKSVTFPEGLQRIGNDAFVGCASLESVVIPNSVTKLEAAFSLCTRLKTVTLSGNIKEYSELAFGGCDGIEHVIVTEGATSLSLYFLRSFQHCDALTKLTLPLSLSSYKGDFAVLTHVTDIYYPGTEAQFMEIKEYQSYTERATVHYECGGDTAD